MKILKKTLLGLVILLLLAAIGGYFYLNAQKPVLAGELTLDGLHETVEVYFDDYGVPHIYAQNEEDAYFALGYVHAQDRLFQMEMLRRAAGGRLSEILGEDLLKVDKFFRTLGLNKFAEKHAEQFFSTADRPYQKAALAYQKGVNQYVKTGKTPLEFTLIGIPKEEFTPKDIYLAVGFMSFGFAEGIRADPLLEKIKNEYGDEYLNALVMQAEGNMPRIPIHREKTQQTPSSKLIAELSMALNKIPVPLWNGSNGWVVSAKKSTSGFPILANDTHIGFSQPAVWYEAHIEYPGFSFYGHHVAGIPFGLLGNNRFCGWGMTMFENDDTDFFIEKSNPENENQVWFKDHWEELNIREETIYVKGKDSITLPIKISRHGPIINMINDDVEDDEALVSLSWMLTKETNPAVEAIYNLNHAASFEDVKKTVATFTAPGLNLMYGDVEGNIAWWAIAKLPVRPKHVNSKFFLDGASGEDEYLGFYPFSKNPQAINPPSGYVYTTNNQPDLVDGISYPGYYYLEARAKRVLHFLESEKNWSLEDMKLMNLDAVSPTHPSVAKELANALKESANEKLMSLVPYLENWNGDHQLNGISPSVYYNVLAFTLKEMMVDELGEEPFKTLLSTSYMKNSYYKLIGSEASPWWDDINTKDKKETRAEIVERAALKALNLISKKHGDDPGQWHWKKMHTLTHGHPLGAVKPLDKIFNVGPLEVPGGIEVLNNLAFVLDTLGHFPVTYGPALRKITDFSNVENGITVSPTGQSGNVMSKHYDDQAKMFTTGQFRKMLMNKEVIQQSENRLVLKPGN